MGKPKVEDLFAGNSEIAALVRLQFVHAKEIIEGVQTPLGAVETWTASLKSAFGILSSSGCPMFLVWNCHAIQNSSQPHSGDRILLYNDAYLSLLEETQHSISRDRVNDSWTENWNNIQADIEQVLTTGQPLQREQNPFITGYSGNNKLPYIWGYSAVWDETGQIRGVFVSGYRTRVEETIATAPAGESCQEGRELQPSQPTSPAQMAESSLQQTEAALRESEARFEAFMSHSPNSAWIADQEGRILYLSPTYARMFQFPQQDAVGKQIHDIYSQEFAQQFIENNRRVFQTGQVVETVETAPQPDGTIGRFLVYKFPIIQPSGEMLLGGVAIDITEHKRIEERLRHREEELRLITDALPALIAYVDKDHYYRFNNQTYETWFGQPADSFVDKPVREILGDAAYEVVRPYMEQALSGERVNFESQIAYQEGEIRYIRADYVPHFDSEGEVKGYFSLVSDISDRRQAEAERERLLQELASERARFEAVLRQMPEGVIIADAASGNLILANERINLILRHSFELNLELEEYDQRTPFHAYHPDGQVYTPDDYPLVRSLQTGEVVIHEEMEIRYLDGSQIVIDASSSPIFDTQGQITSAIVLIQDITERKQAELEREQLLAREQSINETLQRFIEHTPVAVIMLDREMRYLFASRRWMQEFASGYTNLKGLSHYEVMTDIPEYWRQVHQRCLAGATERCEEDYYPRADGSALWLHWEVLPWYASGGEVGGIIIFAENITERKQAAQEREKLLKREQESRQEAEQANRIKDEFLAVLSHELRSPLNPILGWTKLLQTRQFDAAATQQALETIERNAKLQTQLIDDLLDVSRILRGKMMLNICEINLVTVIDAAVETVRLSAEAKSIEIHKVIASDIELILGDSGRLQQVFWNLLSNAIKFTPMGGQVVIELSLVAAASPENEQTKTKDEERRTNYAQIQVRDTGKGITPEFLPYVFEYFRQEDGTTTRKFGGLGLGLAIVRYLTELHGGTVEAESPGEGLGATFTVKLPLQGNGRAGDWKRERTPHLPAVFPPHPLKGLRVLVVDDETDMRELTFTILEQAGAETKVAASAVAALNALDVFKPDVLISDIGMPEVNGYELMHRIRSLPPERGGRIPAIALTAYATEIDQQHALAAGFQQHLAKPIEPEALVRAIATLVKP